MNKIVLALSIFILLFSGKANPQEKIDTDLSETFAYYFYQTGDYQKAIEEYTRILQNTENKAKIHYNLGCIYSKTGNYPQAIKEFQQAAQTNGKIKKEAQYNLMVIYGKHLNDSGQASEYYNKFKNNQEK